MAKPYGVFNFVRIVGFARMLAEFDQNTLANITAALDSICKKIPADKDSHAVSKRIGDAIIKSANAGRRTFVDFQNAGLRASADATRKLASPAISLVY